MEKVQKYVDITSYLELCIRITIHVYHIAGSDCSDAQAHLSFWLDTHICRFVCVEVLQPNQPNGVMSSAVSLPNHTFTGQY